MSQSVNYLMSGNAHAPYVVTSLCTLREHYTGEVVVWAYPESLACMQAIAADTRLGIITKLWTPEYRGKNGQFFNKLALMRSLPEGVHVYLDADTMIQRSIEYLLTVTKRSGFAATQFNDWVSTGNVIKKRVSRLLEIPGICKQNVQFVLDNPLPSLNGGVLACRSDSAVLQVWQEWTKLALEIFIADETVLHAVMARYYRTNWMSILDGGSWNCSPKYQPKTLKDEDVAIWHFHGDCNVRPNKSQKGFDLWWPRFQQCLKDNVGNMQDWIVEASNQNRFLKELMK